MTPGEDVYRELIDERPVFHQGLPDNHVDEAVLRFLFERTAPGMQTLETGAGYSTVVFAARGANHVCITPARDEIDAIRRFLEAHALAGASVRFVPDRSDRVLPSLAVPAPLDIVLIDGCHGFPLPALDWFYLAPHLRVGGILILDNIELWPVGIVRQFLRAEKEWRQVVRFPRAAVFRKETEYAPVKEWSQQAYVRRKSFWTMKPFQCHRAWSLVKQGKFATLVRKMFSG